MSSGEHQLIAGRYRPVRQLGRGGMGVVWRAVDEVLGREVAVKELRTYTDSSGPELAELRVRMQREARAAARVRHPGVIAVHDIADHEGRPVIVMELVDGPSLADVLAERGTLDPREAARVGAEVSQALAAAHRVGVLHRDVKPGNVLLDRTGRVVLTDFGIAAMEDPDDGAATHLTRSGELVGSLDYLAPERAQGQEPGPASDVWALGATLYAAVEGASPFRRTSTWSTLTAIVAEPLPEPHGAGPLAPVLRQLMAKDPAHRPDAATAARLLAGVADGADGPGAYVPTEHTALPPRGFGPPPQAPQAPQGEQGPHGWPGHAASQGPPGAHGAHGAQGRPVAQDNAENAAGTGPGGGFGAPASGHPGAGHPTAGPGAAGAQPAPGAGAVPGADRPGFGAAHAGGFGGPVPLPGHAPAPSGADGTSGAGASDGGRAATRAARSRSRSGRSRAVVAAAVAAVVLAGGGVTYVLTGREEAPQGGQALTGGQVTAEPVPSVDDDGMPLAPAADASPSTSTAPRTDPRPTPSRGGSPSPSAAAAAPGPGGGSTTGGADGGATGGTTAGGSTGGSAGGTTGGSAAGGGSGTTGGGGAQAPACHPIGGGKYNCTVWRTATSHRGDGSQAGVLNAGTNYFYCQSDLGRRETHGEWTNVWWAKTDDDSGNTGVWVSDVYIRGGDNDAPLPGLPHC
ncbi:serine/threonine-protein kinase [Streptomyces kanasensis]|uniref:serine/threonine-protein kinase n=1 Tax=Streptomyces kanasensis TaxID=936756 RepID=UPI003806E550